MPNPLTKRNGVITNLALDAFTVKSIQAFRPSNLYTGAFSSVTCKYSDRIGKHQVLSETGDCIYNPERY